MGIAWAADISRKERARFVEAINKEAAKEAAGAEWGSGIIVLHDFGGVINFIYFFAVPGSGQKGPTQQQHNTTTVPPLSHSISERESRAFLARQNVFEAAAALCSWIYDLRAVSLLKQIN